MTPDCSLVFRGIESGMRAAMQAEQLSKVQAVLIEFFLKLFDTEGFPKRRNCGPAWTDEHAQLHILSDFAIAFAYFAIPCVIAYFILRRRKDLPFMPILGLFAAFILTCGIGHAIEATIFWHPWYRLSGIIKLATAIVSWATVFVLIPAVPKVLSYPGMAETNQKLELEIRERKKTESELITLVEKHRATQQEMEIYAEELERSNRDLDEFAYSASHDLRSPLRAIDGLTRIVIEDVGEQLPDETREDLHMIQHRVERLDRLLNDLLEYSRVGRSPDEIQVIDVGQMLGDAIEIVIPPPGFSVEWQDMPTIKTNRAPLELVFRNLIQNAIKHHDAPGGIIEIKAEPTKTGTKFSVIDDGPGIPAEYQKLVFGMFKTLKPRDEVEGSGMGLALIKKIVETQGGKIRIVSEGRGACFEFTWPNRRKRKRKKTDGKDAGRSHDSAG